MIQDNKTFLFNFRIKTQDLETPVNYASEEENEMEIYLQLPDEVWAEIISILDNKSKYQVALTCQRFNNIIKTYSAVYKTFQINFYGRPKDDTSLIPRLTRPCPTVKFDYTEYVDSDQEHFKSLMRFFETNGKFVKKIVFYGLYATKDRFAQILNEFPNAEDIFFDGHVKHNVADPDNFKNFKAKHNFPRLKKLILEFFPFDDLPFEDLSFEIFDEFFGKCESISTLGLTYYFNILYNKPKLETLYINFTYTNPIVMEAANEFKFVSNLKELNICADVRGEILDPEDSNAKNLQQFIKTQFGIEKFAFYVFTEFLTNSLFNDILQHVINFNPIKFYAVRDIERSQSDLFFFKRLPAVTRLRITSNLDYTLPFFPNLRYLHLATFALNYQAINSLQFLEKLVLELYSREKIEFGKFNLKNLKKLHVSGTGNETSFENAKIIMETHPNIEDFTWNVCFSINEHSIKQQEGILKTANTLKIYCCYPEIMATETESLLRFLQTFVDYRKKLELLRFNLPFNVSESTIKSITEYFHINMPTVKFDYAKNNSYMYQPESWESFYF